MDIMVLNKNFESVAIIDSYKSFIWTDRYDEYGDFEIYLPMDSKWFEVLEADYYLWLKESEHCMIVEDFKIEADVEEGNHLIVTGRSLESILDRRVLWGQRVYSGSLQTAIQSMLNDCIISPSITERQISNFIFTASNDAKITALTIDQQYMGDNLYDVIKALCEENNIGFKVVLTDDNKFEFSLYAGVDRSYSQTDNPYVIFSPGFSNIINSNFVSTKSTLKNVALVAGEGEGSARKLATVGTASGIDRREYFCDASDISTETEDGTIATSEYTKQLQAKGTKELTEHTATTAFEGEVEATRPFTYGEDFFVGDIVQIANEYGNEGSACISELVITHDEEGLSIYPTFKTYTE